MDGLRWTSSDHNSSLSTPCSGELIKRLRIQLQMIGESLPDIIFCSNPLLNNLDLVTPAKEPCENIVCKGENAGARHFFLFQKCFLPIKDRYHNQYVVR